jgi:hypothetical protein
MGSLLAKSTIRIILQYKEEILRSFEAIPGKKASKIRSKIMLDYEQILTVEVKEAFSRSSGLLDVNLDIDLTPTEIEQINSNFEDNFDVEIHISETSKKIIENLQQKSVPIQDLNVTSDITSCINNLTIVPEKSVDLPAASNSGENNGRKRLSAGDSASVMQPRKKQLKLTDLLKKNIEISFVAL